MNKLQKVLSDYVKRGLPFLFLRSKDGNPSVTLTTVVISFIICVISLIPVISDSEYVGGIDFDNALNLYIGSLVLYLGRKVQSTNLTSEINKEEK